MFDILLFNLLFNSHLVSGCVCYCWSSLEDGPEVGVEEDPFSFRYVQTAVCMTGFTDLAFSHFTFVVAFVVIVVVVVVDFLVMLFF